MAKVKHLCPCKNCKGIKRMSPSAISRHLNDFGYDGDDEEDVEEPPDGDIFLKNIHLKGRDKPLYHGSSITLLQAVMMLLHIYSTFPGTSQAFMTALLGLLGGYLLPADNILPRTFAGLKSVISDLLAPIEKVEMCRNKCILYIDENDGLTSCPRCSAPRSKKFTYTFMRIIPRLKRWWSIPKVAKALQTHLSPVDSETEPMTDIQQSPAWTGFMTRMGGDRRCMGFALSTDGMDPFNHLHIPYSMWPITLKAYNLPPQIRDQFGWLLLFGIIPGPDTPKDMEPFFRLLMDECEDLHEGIRMYDGFQKNWFNLRCEILTTITDLPGGNKLHKTANINAVWNACWQCEQNGEYVKPYSRTLYQGNERFLPQSSPLRAKMGKTGADSKPPPRERTKEEVVACGHAVEEMKQRVEKGEATNAQLEQLQKSTGRRGLDELHRLDYYDPVIGRPLDMMHAVLNAIKKFFDCINGHVEPNKTLKTEQTLGRFRDIVPTVVPGKRKAGQEAAVSVILWALDRDGLHTADMRIMQIKVPDGFGFKPQPFFKKPPYMKSHDWMQIGTHGILKFAVRGLLGEDQMRSMCKFLDCLTTACQHDITAEEAQALEPRFHEALAEVELYWPLCMQTITMHMMHHVAKMLELYGPPQSTWAYGSERFNQFLGVRVTKRDTPETNVMEKYRIYELTQMTALLGLLPPGAINTDPGAQLQAITEAREDIDVHQLYTDEGLDCHLQPEQEEVQPSVQGTEFLTSQLQKPEDITFSALEVALISRATHSKPGNVAPQGRRHYSARLRKPRQQLVSCALSDKDESSTCSSYVGVLSDSGEVTFGRVLYFVHAHVGGKSAELALVEWCSVPRATPEGLWHVNSTEVPLYEPSFVMCKVLPPPLVTAKDGESLFFLDANPARMPTLCLK